MNNIQISVIVPAYNEEIYIGRCLRSLLNQSILKDNYEIIVVDDNSIDNTFEVIKLYIDKIKYLKNAKNEGLPYSLNVGIKNAKGNYIVRVDSDDYVHTDFLKILSMHLQLNKKIDAIACDYFKVDEQENILSNSDCFKDPIGCGIMFRTQHMVEMGMYNQDFIMAEEEEFRVRFEKKYKISRVQIPLYRYRQHDNNMSKDTNKKNEYQNKIRS